MEEFIKSFILMEMFILSGTIALLGKLRYNFSYQLATVRFINLVRAFGMYLIIDITLGCMLYNVIGSANISIHILVIGEYLCFGLIPYLWFLYAEEILETDHFKNSIIPKIYTFIMASYCLLVLTSFKTGLIYSIGSEGQIYIGLYNLKIMRFILILFFGTATIYGIINLVSSKSKVLIKKSIRVIGFVIPIMFTWFIYYIYGIADCIPLAIFISILFCFLSLEDPMNYVDELTGLYNRKKLISLYDERKVSYLRDRLNILYYIDANDFKEINDTYGHLEGDKVLKIIGKAFKNIDEYYHSISIRLGGDEFVILACTENVKGIDFKAVIRDEIAKVAMEEGCEYAITTSIGSAILYGDAEDSLAICLDNADNDMYHDKCEIKSERKSITK